MLLPNVTIEAISIQYAQKTSVREPVSSYATKQEKQVVIKKSLQEILKQPSFKNKQVAVVLWASWCATCIQELQNLSGQKNMNVIQPVVLINVNESWKIIEKSMKKYAPNLKSYRITKQEFIKLNTMGVPTVLWVKNNNILKTNFSL